MDSFLPGTACAYARRPARACDATSALLPGLHRASVLLPADAHEHDGDDPDGARAFEDFLHLCAQPPGSRAEPDELLNVRFFTAGRWRWLMGSYVGSLCAHRGTAQRACCAHHGVQGC